MHKIIVTILVIISITTFCKAQAQTSCLSENQLLRLQISSSNDINTFLSNEGWSVENNQNNQTREYFDYYLDFNVQKWEQKSSIYWEGTIFIYYKEGIPNLIIYQSTNACFINLNPDKKQVEKNGFKNSIIQKTSSRVIEYRDYHNETSNKRFSILIYNSTSLNNLVLIERTRLDSYNKAIATGNDFFLQKKFEDAIGQYEIAKKYLLYREHDLYVNLESRIQNSKRGIVQLAFDNFKEAGDTLYKQKKFEDAIIQYGLAKKNILPGDNNAFADIESRIQNSKRGIIDKFKEVGDSLFE